jgi:hypothetical protein
MSACLITSSHGSMDPSAIPLFPKETDRGQSQAGSQPASKIPINAIFSPSRGHSEKLNLAPRTSGGVKGWCVLAQGSEAIPIPAHPIPSQRNPSSFPTKQSRRSSQYSQPPICMPRLELKGQDRAYGLFIQAISRQTAAHSISLFIPVAVPDSVALLSLLLTPTSFLISLRSARWIWRCSSHFMSS